MIAAYFLLAFSPAVQEAPQMALADDILITLPRQSTRIETKHYILHMDGFEPELEEQAKFMEAAFESFADLLKKKPRTKRGTKTIVRIFRNRSAWRAGLDLEQEVPPKSQSGMHYSAERRTIYLYGRYKDFALRKWLIHGMFLDFHRNLKSKNRYLDSEWYITGMADTLSTFNWDGKDLELAAIKTLPANNRAHVAIFDGGLERIEDGVLSDEDLRDANVRWALTAFFMFGDGGSYSKKFERHALGSTGSMLYGTELLPIMGDPKEIVAQLTGWVKERSRHLHPHGDWHEDGKDLIGKAHLGIYSFALADDRSETLQVTTSADIMGRAGLLVDWTDRMNYILAGLEGDKLYIQLCTDGRMRTTDQFDVKVDKDGQIKVKMERKDQNVLLTAPGAPTLSIPVRSRKFGLFVTGGEASFAELTWR
jgi:hypothetical protein